MPAPTSVSDKLASVSSNGTGVFLTGKVDGYQGRVAVANGGEMSILGRWQTPFYRVKLRDFFPNIMRDRGFDSSQMQAIEEVLHHYRKLNDVTRKDAYPLPRIDDALDSLTNACWFSTLDLVQYLGHVISAEGVMADPSKVEAVQAWPTPKTQTEVRSFVGLASYYRRFIKGFAEIARPLHQLTEKGKRFVWREECQEAFQQLKSRLISAPVLAYPDPKKPFILDTDASDVGVGAVLSQEDGGLERVVAYASRALTKQERKYATTKKELLSVVTFTKHFKHYLLGREFLLRTDHSSLRWLHNFSGLEGQLARWLEQLANFQYKIIHRPGKQHTNADALSRLPGSGSRGSREDCGNVPPSRVPVTVVRAVREAEGMGGPIRDLPESEDELVKAQQEDPNIQLLINLKNGSVDDGREGERNPALVSYSPVWDQLHMRNQRLVRIPPANSDAASAVQVILPKSLVPGVLSMLHNTPTGGHLGIQKLQAKVKDRFYWPGWFGDVKKWCRECRDCASRKDGKAPVPPFRCLWYPAHMNVWR
ncbi:hypothetical protein F2P79_015127 [Pimephales promelas]|nr:hypothetical protein F2P79_015127 [Pimephales promelas]